jgi:hypothetical protein
MYPETMTSHILGSGPPAAPADSAAGLDQNLEAGGSRPPRPRSSFTSCAYAESFRAPSRSGGS